MNRAHQYTPEEVQAFNKVLQNWAALNYRRLKSSSFGTISAQLQNKNKYNYGLLEAIGYKFPRHGVFVEMGVFGRLKKQQAIAQGKLNPNPWFNPVIEKAIPELTAIVARINANFVVNAAQTLIKNT